jgi:putative transposase
MRTARFTESRWWRSCAGLIAPVSAAAKRHGLDEQTLYTWRKPFGGFQANDGRRLKSWEVEKKWLPSVRPAPLSFSNHRCSGI